MYVVITSNNSVSFYSILLKILIDIPTNFLINGKKLDRIEN